ncbi:gram-negative bacteria-binding protein 1-2 precursor [Apis mellifera caucasica]|uniref:Gram-negative bacteria-binding protein 1-2 precursor n=2 Tax=Apis mellifera TaxID=7460 RepID=A0A7M6UV61_APIME|nr:gram-negative bacteria-binding protein 1-2 precursor [Apis mellifera]KAG6801368.1 gram-negative bacteria-binding protein 1-2 precursor [Apis mellifera caucasica]KAG9431336.1 gram-negative bacteria-binding protein 1-2 precursor [Apis mellifera carnica]|eukprot:NP_001157186.1 gram-negative bacteria-binding protein 1-2 precursor [Apis mellifera]
MKILFMTNCFIVIIISLFSIAIQENLAQYVPPTPSVEPLYPVGLRMSIADEAGISLVAYHVKFNDDFYSLEAGTIARDIIKPRNGYWVYEDRSTRLKLGDIIYYWIHVVYNGLGYNLLDQKHVVNEFYNYDGSPHSNGKISLENKIDTCIASSQTKIFESNSKNQLLNTRICPGQLIFEENFDSLNTTRWTILERFAGPPSYEFVIYMNNIENVKIKDGILHIEPTLTNEKYGPDFIRTNNLTLEKCTEMIENECKRFAFGSYILPPVISGRLNTKSSFNFQYGRIQIRAKLPRGDWLFPLITLESTDMCTKNSSIYCDIIIVHSNGNSVLMSQDGNDLSGHFLLGGAHATDINSHVPHDNKLNLPKKKSETLWSDEYHVYDLEWKPNQIIVKVDGVEYGQQNVPGLYDIPVYINIGLAVGGHTIFPDNCISNNYVKPWRNVGSKALYHFHLAEKDWIKSWRVSDTGLHVDYIKIWAV